MAKRYVAVTDVTVGRNGMIAEDTVGIEVRAKSMKQAEGQALAVLAAAYPGFRLTNNLEVSRLKQNGKKWRPVSAYVAGILPAVRTWLAPKDVEMTDIETATDNVTPLLPKPKEVSKPAAVTKPTLKPLGFTDEVIRSIGHSWKTYTAQNEVEQ